MIDPPSGRIGFALGVLLAVALAGCLGPGPVQDDGPPVVVTVEMRYVPEVPVNLSGTEGGDVNRRDAARLPNGTVATYPMYVGLQIWNGRSSADGRGPSQARTGWTYDDAPCRYWRPHSPRRVQDNLCDGVSVRSRHVLPPLYPQDRAENYSWDVRMGWHGRGYVYSTANDSDESKPWNYTKGFGGDVPLGMDGSVRLVFHHRVPISINLGGPSGEIPERMDEEVIEPENCTSDGNEPYDYVKGMYGEVADLHGAAEWVDRSEGDAFILRGDARVVLEWSAVCVRDKGYFQS